MFSEPRPNRLSETKDEDYHLRFAKYCIGNYERSFHYAMVEKYLINSAFYKGNQWCFNEDLDAFFMDEDGDARNRIKIVHNIVKPYVEYLRGSVVRMDINFDIESLSREAKNRRESALHRLLVWHRTMEEATPATASAIKQSMMLGDTPQETEDSFNNLYTDQLSKNMKHFVRYVANYENDFEDLKNNLGEDLALAGICIAKETDRNGKQLWDRVFTTKFGFDMSARKRDLSDAEYMLDFDLVSAVDILEEYPNLTVDQRRELEQIKCSSVPGLHNVSDFYFGQDVNKVPKYCVYWRDIETRRHCAVIDAFGYPRLVDFDEGGYTEEQIIPEDQLAKYRDGNDWIETVLQNKSERKIPIDYCGYCIFVPSLFTDNASEDIVLDCGARKYSPLYSFSKKKVDYPYKVQTYAYIDGEIISPVDALISPQRYMNRVLSVAESQINNSRGSGVFIDGDAIQDADGIGGIIRNMNQSKPVVVYGGRQLNNSVIPYDSNIKQGTLSLFNIAEGIKSMSDDTIGGGEALRGGGGGYRVSVGAVEQNLNQGTILQESYFYALTKVIFKSYDSILNRGRRIYCANAREISMALGDEGYVTFKMSKEYEAEEFMLKIERVASSAEQKQIANQTLFDLLANQLIDNKIFAKYYNNSDMSTVAYAIREYQSIIQEQAKLMEKQKNEANNKALVAASGEMAMQNMAEEKADSTNLQSTNANLKLEQAKLASNEKIAKDALEASKEKSSKTEV